MVSRKKLEYAAKIILCCFPQKSVSLLSLLLVEKPLELTMEILEYISPGVYILYSWYLLSVHTIYSNNTWFYIHVIKTLLLLLL